MDLVGLKTHLDTLENYQLSSLYGGTLPRRWRVAIGCSKYGKGLFAQDALPAGVAVTLYPAHATGEGLEKGKYRMTVVEGIGYEARPEYLLSTPTGGIICGYPEMTENDWFVGHMANDGADITCFRKDKEYESAVLYNIMSQSANMRVEWYKGVAILVTTKDVLAGEELVWPYGIMYWFARKGITKADERIRDYLLRQPRAKREQMVALLTSMPDIFAKARDLKALERVPGDGEDSGKTGASA